MILQVFCITEKIVPRGHSLSLAGQTWGNAGDTGCHTHTPQTLTLYKNCMYTRTYEYLDVYRHTHRHFIVSLLQSVLQKEIIFFRCSNLCGASTFYFYLVAFLSSEQKLKGI